MNRLGQKIKQLRLKKGMKQGELAKGLVTPSMISQIEAGKANPSHKLLEQLAERLDTSVHYFLSDIQFKQEQSSSYRLAKNYMDHEDYQRASILLEELASQDEFFMNHPVFLDLAECWTKLGKHKKALDMYQTLYEKGLQQTNHELSVLSLNKQGVIFYNRQQFSIAEWYWEQAYSLAQRNKDISVSLFAQVQLNLGTVYARLAQYPTSQSYYLNAYELLRGTNYMDQIADACLGLGLAYRAEGNYQKAIEYTQDAVTIYRSLNFHLLELNARVNLSIIKRENCQPEESMEILNYCVDEYAKLNRWNDVANVKAELARTYISTSLVFDDPVKRQSNLETAIRVSNEALQYASDLSTQQADIFETLGDIRALEKNYDEAVDYYKKSIQIFAKRNLITPVMRVCTALAKLNRDNQKYRDATETYLEMERLVEIILKNRLPLEID